MALSYALAELVAVWVARKVVGELTVITVNLQQMGDPMLGALVHALCIGYPGVVACIAAGVSLSEEDIEGCSGLADVAESMRACVLHVRSIQQQLRKEVHAHARPMLPWPGGWPKFAFLVLLSWPDTGTTCSIERVLELLSQAEGVTSDMVLCVGDVQGLLTEARQVFQTRQAALTASGQQSHVFGVAQAIAATLFDVFHEQELWDGGCDVECEAVSRGLSWETGVQYADKDWVMKPSQSSATRLVLC